MNVVGGVKEIQMQL